MKIMVCQQITMNSWNYLKRIAVAVPVWWESSRKFERYMYFSEIFTYLSPAVTLKIR